jgi:hypothetical protein
VSATGEDSAATGIGGDQASNSASDSDVVYVFTRTGTAWSQQAYVEASNTETGDWLGVSVALSSDGSTLAAGVVGGQRVQRCQQQPDQQLRPGLRGGLRPSLLATGGVAPAC